MIFRKGHEFPCCFAGLPSGPVGSAVECGKPFGSTGSWDLVRVQLTLAEVFDNMYGWGPEHGVSLPPNLTRESIGKWGLISGFGGTVASLSDKAYELSWESSAIWIDQLTHTPGNQYQSYQQCSHDIGTSHWSVSLQTRVTTAWLWYEDDWQHLARSGNHLLKLFFAAWSSNVLKWVS